MRCSVSVMVQAWRALQGEGKEAQVVSQGIFWMEYEQPGMDFMKIISENISQTYVITFRESE